MSVRQPEEGVPSIQDAGNPEDLSGAEGAREAPVRVVQDVALESQPIHMSVEGFAEFMEVLSRPAEQIPEMAELVRQPAPWERDETAKR